MGRSRNIVSRNDSFMEQKNKEVNQSLAEVIRAWKTSDRAYNFESRGFAGFMKPKFLNGEAIMRFHINIDGFFEDERCTRPIDLSYDSDLFQTSILSEEGPVNPDIDAKRLKTFLDDFTASAYQEARKCLDSYTTMYTSDL